MFVTRFLNEEEKMGKKPVGPFVVWVTYAGYDQSLDEKIRKAVAPTESDGSGYGLGMRDISFTFKTLRLAEAAEKKILKTCPSCDVDIRSSS